MKLVILAILAVSWSTKEAMSKTCCGGFKKNWLDIKCVVIYHFCRRISDIGFQQEENGQVFQSVSIFNCYSFRGLLFHCPVFLWVIQSSINPFAEA